MWPFDLYLEVKSSKKIAAVNLAIIVNVCIVSLEQYFTFFFFQPSSFFFFISLQPVEKTHQISLSLSD